MRSHHVKSTIGHLGLSRSILRCFDTHDFKSNRFRAEYLGGKLYLVVVGWTPTGKPACLDKASGQLTIAAILLG